MYTIILYTMLLAGGPVGCWGTNHPPDIGFLGPLTVTVGETLTVALFSVDPDGDPVVFDVSGAPKGARIEADTAGAWQFRYSPLASDAGPDGAVYDLVFTARDNRGGSTDETTTLTVLPEGSVPVFTGPFAWTLNLAGDDHLTAVIPVRDDDTANLDIEIVRGIDGAVFQTVDGHTASMYWKPRPGQIDEGPVHTFMVSADDGTHPRVFADFAVILVNSEMFGGCPGTPPTASHTPLFDQHGTDGYQLTVLADDMESRVQSVRCLWSAVKGVGEADMNSLDLNRLDLASAQGDEFTGTIPDLSAASGDGRIVYYHFLVTDDDDQQSQYCDHSVRVPKGGEFAFAAYGVDHPDACMGDVFGDPPGSVPQLPDGTMSALRLCNGKSDVFTKVLSQGEGLAVVARPMSASPPLTVEIEDPWGATVAQAKRGAWALAGVDGEYRVRVSPQDAQPVTYEMTSAVMTSQCAPDAFEPNQTPAGAASVGEGSVEAVICPADTDNYGFHLDTGQAADLSIVFDPKAADLDLFLFRKGAQFPQRVSASTTGTEELVIEAPGDYVAMVRAAGLGSADYVMNLRIEGQSVLCEDDLFSPNQTAQQAPVVFETVWDKLKLCPGKADFLRTDLNGGEDLSVWVQAATGEAAPALVIMREDGQTVLAKGEVADGQAMAKTVAPGPVRIGPAGDQSVAYSLGFTAKDPPGECRPDRLEPNDAIEAAGGIGQSLLTHLTLCPGDQDFFAMKMGAWQAISAWVLNGTVAAHAVLVDGDQQTVAVGSPVQYGEELFFLTHEKGTYYLKVTASSGGQGWYDVAAQTE
ncbi:MAG: hypothetical protein GXP54_03920 [Deltaproteobacteria bacterium]|nr:hypothetical protein [Deltaproteobacteria bacterium]